MTSTSVAELHDMPISTAARENMFSNTNSGTPSHLSSSRSTSAQGFNLDRCHYRWRRCVRARLWRAGAAGGLQVTAGAAPGRNGAEVDFCPSVPGPVSAELESGALGGETCSSHRLPSVQTLVGDADLWSRQAQHVWSRPEVVWDLC